MVAGRVPPLPFFFPVLLAFYVVGDVLVRVRVRVRIRVRVRV